jgi:hypothetical protein
VTVDAYQLARAGEAMEDLRLAIKDETDKNNMNYHAWRVVEAARATLAEALERLGE